MEYTRAVEILKSPKTFEVLYEGTPIWIESLNSEQNTAIISSGDFNQGKKNVSVGQLVESQITFS